MGLCARHVARHLRKQAKMSAKDMASRAFLCTSTQMKSGGFVSKMCVFWILTSEAIEWIGYAIRDVAMVGLRNTKSGA